MIEIAVLLPGRFQLLPSCPNSESLPEHSTDRKGFSTTPGSSFPERTVARPATKSSPLPPAGYSERKRKITQPVLLSIAQRSRSSRSLRWIMPPSASVHSHSVLSPQKRRGRHLPWQPLHSAYWIDQLPAIALSTASAPTSATAKATTPPAACTRFLGTCFIHCKSPATHL